MPTGSVAVVAVVALRGALFVNHLSRVRVRVMGQYLEKAPPKRHPPPKRHQAQPLTAWRFAPDPNAESRAWPLLIPFRSDQYVRPRARPLPRTLHAHPRDHQQPRRTEMTDFRSLTFTVTTPECMEQLQRDVSTIKETVATTAKVLGVVTDGAAGLSGLQSETITVTLAGPPTEGDGRFLSPDQTWIKQAEAAGVHLALAEFDGCGARQPAAFRWRGELYHATPDGGLVIDDSIEAMSINGRTFMAVKPSDSWG